MTAFVAPIGVTSLLLVLLSGCANGRTNERDSTTSGNNAITGNSWDPARWQPPSINDLPGDSAGAAVRRGFALITATHDSLPALVGANLNCTSCHLDEGRRATASPLGGVYARYPRYIERAAAVVPIEDRVNYCFTRSLAGSRLPNDSRPMQDIVAYLAFASRGVPMGASVGPARMPAMPPARGDTARGALIYHAACARCHGADGAGLARIPALWGPKSFSIGASMARQERAASFIRHNMPFDKPGTLTDAEAYDVAAFVTAKPRPDLPGKERDWPTGDAPADVPYDTKGHRAYLPPPLLPRRNPSDAYVPPPHMLPRPPAENAPAGRPMSQSRSGPGSSSAPPLPAEPNFGLVTLPVVVCGGFCVRSFTGSAAGVWARPSASSGESAGCPSTGGSSRSRSMRISPDQCSFNIFVSITFGMSRRGRGAG